MSQTHSPESLRAALRAGKYVFVRDYVRSSGEGDVAYLKCLCDALAQLRDWAGAIEVAKANLGGDPYFSELLIAKFYQNAQDIENAWVWLERARRYGETLSWLTTASKAAYLGGELDRAVEFGQRVLEFKDRSLSEGSNAKVTSSGTRKVVSFSLFGSADIYLMGALANARLWARLAPGWVCRFYLATDVPEGIAGALRQLGAEVSVGDIRGVPAYMSRFLPLQDPEVERFICRDVDCRPTQTEIAMLAEWESSDWSFHVIRNHPLHTDLVLAGLWGGRPIEGFDLAREVAECFPLGASNKYGLDQVFLERRVWRLVRSSLLTHDAHYRFDGLDCRPLHDPKLGGGYQDPSRLPKELEKLGIRVNKSASK